MCEACATVKCELRQSARFTLQTPTLSRKKANSMLFLIARGVTLGFTAGMLPGPLQTYLIQTTLVQGWRKSLIMVISPLIADIPVIILTVFVLAQLPPAFIRIVQIVGGLFVLYLA